MRQYLIKLLLLCASVVQAREKVYDFIVAADGSGDFVSLQAAIDALPDDSPTQKFIFIKAGTYEGHVYIPLSKSRLSVVGEGMDRVIITDRQVSGGPTAVPVDKGATVVVHANDVTFEGVSFVNAHGVEANDGPQALALYAKGDRIALSHCGIYSYQDTYRTSEPDNARNYVAHSTIMGAVDFIYGNGNAWLEQCTIKINRPDGGFIVAPKHQPVTRWGYVFNRCTITADGPDPAQTRVWLGRPWHHQPQTVFLNTRMEVTVPAEGWYPMMAGLPSVFAEYNSVDAQGRPIDLSRRQTRYYRVGEKGDTTWCTAKSTLTADEAARYTVESVMGGDDQWQPEALFRPARQPRGYVVFRDERLVGIFAKLKAKYQRPPYKALPVNAYGCF